MKSRFGLQFFNPIFKNPDIYILPVGRRLFSSFYGISFFDNVCMCVHTEVAGAHTLRQTRNWLMFLISQITFFEILWLHSVNDIYKGSRGLLRLGDTGLMTCSKVRKRTLESIRWNWFQNRLKLLEQKEMDLDVKCTTTNSLLKYLLVELNSWS